MNKSILIRGLSEETAEGLQILAERDGMTREVWLRQRLEQIVATERSMHSGDLAQSVLNLRRELGDVPAPVRADLL